MSYNKNEKSSPSPYIGGGKEERGNSNRALGSKRLVISGCLGFALLTVFVIGLIGWFVWKLMRSEDHYRVEGRATIANIAGKSYLVSVVGHFKALSVEKNGGSTIRRGSREFYLTVNKLPLGELVAKKKLEHGKERLTTINIRLLEVLGEELYLVAGRPMRLSLPFLEEKPISTEVDNTMLPNEYLRYLPDSENYAIWIELKDGYKAWLNTKSGVIHPLPDEKAPPYPADKDARLIRAVTGLSSPRYTDLITPWYLKTDNSLYFFSSPDVPLKSISSNALTRYHYRENERVNLYKAIYERNQRMGNLMIREETVEQVGNETFLQGGFLKDEMTGEALQPAKGLLVASRTLTGKEGLLQLTWLDSATGGIKFRESVTGIDNVKQILFSPDFLVIIGTEFGTSNADPGRDRIYVAYTKEGALQYFHIHIQ
jgi:hypothetical protein